ncbi:hypothetical protein PPROV_000095200 [Pycnococcus provasolii]|uniref:Uncharacterized protein n=1 Tax=Pycnococcus provasolii TaxID=41880 RepID=A0A830H562_9CHLO|nr:hypothetical protein PPROV_000095200 [Pycnococcus provasolii]
MSSPTNSLLGRIANAVASPFYTRRRTPRPAAQNDASTPENSLDSDVSVLSRHVDMAAKIPSLQIQGCGWGKTIATWTVGAPAWVYMDAPSSRIFSDAKDAKEALPMLLDPFATANVSRASGLVASKGKKNLDGLPFAMAKEGGRRRPVTLFITLVETLNVTLVTTLVITLDLGLGLGL